MPFHWALMVGDECPYRGASEIGRALQSVEARLLAATSPSLTWPPLPQPPKLPPPLC
jgi:hypothetical protein